MRRPDLAVYKKFYRPDGNAPASWADVAPVLLVEVASAGQEDFDYRAKRRDYWRTGAREYWIVDPKRGVVLFLRRGDADWEQNLMLPGDTYTTPLLPGFKLSVRIVFGLYGGTARGRFSVVAVCATLPAVRACRIGRLSNPEYAMISRFLRLSVMMFLQYAIWGVWAPILGLHLGGLEGFDGSQTRIGYVYMTMPIASIIAPFLGGQIADRWFAAQRFLAVSHFLGGIILLGVARLTGFAEVFIGMLLYNLLYAPTIALTNSIVFHHWPGEKFSQIRVAGSIGWIAIGWVFGAWLGSDVLMPMGEKGMGNCLYFAAILSFVLGVFALTLPHTPPTNKPGSPWAFVDAFAMMRNPAFAVMAIVAFFVAIELQCYFVWTQSFFEKGLKLQASWIPRVMTLGQICEMVMMVLLPFVLKRAGFRLTMAMGIAAWALRDFVFAIGQPTGLDVAAVALHGIGFAFFFTVIFMFADTIAPKDIKSSAQSFLSSVTIGMGMLVGSRVAGAVGDHFAGDWRSTYMVPAVLCAVCCVVFLLGFRPRTEGPARA